MKLLLTVRSYFLNEVLSHLDARDRTDRVELIKLDYLSKEEKVEPSQTEVEMKKQI